MSAARSLHAVSPVSWASSGGATINTPGQAGNTPGRARAHASKGSGRENGSAALSTPPLFAFGTRVQTPSRTPEMRKTPQSAGKHLATPLSWRHLLHCDLFQGKIYHCPLAIYF